VPVAHTCNPSYSGGRDQEDFSSKAALTKYFTRPYLKTTQHKKKLYSICFASASMKSMSSPVPPKTKQQQKKTKIGEMVQAVRAPA
jgi:hypothetical protein